MMSLIQKLKPKYDCSADMRKIAKYDNNNKNNVFPFGDAALNEACDSFEFFFQGLFYPRKNYTLIFRELF